MLSVIIPVYNVEKYLRRCLDSVLNQTYRDLEIILIDDGSYDDSGKICDEYAGIDFRVKVVHQQNAGQAKARNVGMQIAIGEYITFVDSDDWIDLNTYENVFEKIKQTFADIIVYSHVEEYFDHQVRKNIDCRKYNDTNMIKQGVLWDHIGSYARNVYRKDLWNGVLFPENCYYEDLAIVIDVYMKADKIEIIDECFYHYNFTNVNSTTRNWSSKSKYGMFLGAVKRIEYAEAFKDIEAKRYFYGRAFKTCVTGLSMNLVRNELKEEQENKLKQFLLAKKYDGNIDKIGIKYKILRWGLLYCKTIPKLYAYSMFALLSIKKKIRR